jgi:aryl-alcohol dehydrogenase-like predicted oxidoreductase
VTDILSSNGRTVAQGALCWLLARSESAVLIPGAQNREQALENAAAAQHGPLSTDEMTAIENALAHLEHT